MNPSQLRASSSIDVLTRAGFLRRCTVTYPGLVLMLLFCSGCGSGVLPVSGSVTFDGQPLKYGTILLRSAEGNESQARQIMLEVRNGKFVTASGLGVPAGKYNVTISIFEGEAPPPIQAPTDGSEGTGSGMEPKVVGNWRGTADVASGVELTFNIEKQALQVPGRGSDSA